MAGATREQALSLIAAAKNHGDLAVKLSSLKQAKEILLSVEPSLAAEFFPYVAELHTSPEALVRRYLVEFIADLCMKAMEQASVLMPAILTLLKDEALIVVKQSVVSGSSFFCSFLQETALQFLRTGRVERWHEELWRWMIKFKDAIFGIAVQPGPVQTKLLAVKFLETCILLFSSDANDSDSSIREGKAQNFNVSWLVSGHPILDPAMLIQESNRSLCLLLDLLQLTNTLCGSVIISVINCLSAVARKRPQHYSTILSALLTFDPNFETLRGHAASVQYSLRTAFLGFLRCTIPAIVESRDTLVRALRAMNAGDAADQVIRKVDKIIKINDRASRDSRFSKEDQLLNSSSSMSGDLNKKRSMLQDAEGLITVDEIAPKRPFYGHAGNSILPVKMSGDSCQEDISTNGISSNVSPLGNDLTPVEQMIAMIGALLAEGERGAESLEILISKIQPDLMADIVITNMKHLPKSPPSIASRIASLPSANQKPSSSALLHAGVSTSTTVCLQSPVVTSEVVRSPPSSVGLCTSSDLILVSNLPSELKRDPRRDPRRLDPRRIQVPTGIQSLPGKEDIVDFQLGLDYANDLNSPSSPAAENMENHLAPNTRCDVERPESLMAQSSDQVIAKENLETLDESAELDKGQEVNTASDLVTSPANFVEQEIVSPPTSDVTLMERSKAQMLESDQHSPVISNTSTPDDSSRELPVIPSYVDLTDEQKINVSKMSIERIFESSKDIQTTGYSQTRMALLARLIAQNDTDDDTVAMLQKHVILDCQRQKGHELAMHVLYYLHFAMVSASDESCSSTTRVYEKFLLAMVKSLRDKLPASDKSLSRFLGEVPLLTDSSLKLLEDLCCHNGFEKSSKDGREGDRVTQGLGAIWSLILGRPLNRKACLDIALRCAVHENDDIRAKAIRLVANKLYPLSYATENIEQFATNMLLSVVDQLPDVDTSQAGSSEHGIEENVGLQETSVSGSQSSEPGASGNESVKGIQQVMQSAPTVSLSHAQKCMSLFFALCIKKPTLLQVVFDIYGRAPKTIKQAIHRHVPVLVKSLGRSYSELLCIISNPPQGSENLLMLVLQILTEETVPSTDLIATVKHLYETKLKDAAVLIPVLSLLSKDEVLPIFARLVGLPLEKFQNALARILQGSAHTGPALTPTEVLIAIHDINPEKDGIPLKKITDACSACFEQRTVFTQQVLAKALNHLVDQTPLPLLFMRTVIQAIDAFPSLVDFVMEILSKLVSKQIWKMPKLWVGFLKCASQTQPHSFHVLLQLPPSQLESALNKYSSLRGPLAVHAGQPSIRSSLPRSSLVVLGLASESQTQRSFLPPALHASDTSSSVHGATPS